MKNFCSSPREHATKSINFEIKEMLPLTKKYLKFLKHFTKDKNNRKGRDHFIGKYRSAAHNLRFNVLKSCCFHNGSSYDYHLIIKELAKQFECTVSYKIGFPDTARFMASSLSNLLIISQWEFRKLYAKILIVFKKSDSGTNISFLIMISINLFCC